jgi:DNA mismatch repair protein MutS
MSLESFEIMDLSGLTPMLRQFYQIKMQYPDCILFFRLGDFYEMFGDDAEVASKVLEITLTSRDAGSQGKIPMCGVPYHAVEGYLLTLVENGYKVAICEQVEDPKLAKGVVKREVTRVVTPGTITLPQALDEKSNNYVACIFGHGDAFGIAYADVSTGDFKATEIRGELAEAKARDELIRLNPKEVIYPENLLAQSILDILVTLRVSHEAREESAFQSKLCYRNLTRHLGTTTLAGFGLKNKPYAVSAAGALFEYLKETQKISLEHIRDIQAYSLNDYMVLDSYTQRNLEILTTLRENKKQGSLLGVLDKTVTAMGGRLLRRYLAQPLIDIQEIEKRSNRVECLFNEDLLRTQLRDSLEKVYDLERLASKLAYQTANARDLVALRDSFRELPGIKDLICQKDALQDLSKLDCLEDLEEVITDAIVDDPPFLLTEGGLIQKGYNKELDELRDIARGGKEWIANLQKKERERTGVKSLKVGFNKVFGYYIEVSNANLNLVPEDYQRKQTLANSERFITPELKEYEAKVLGAEEKINSIEYDLFCQTRDRLKDSIGRIQQTAHLIAELDVYASLAEVAKQKNYVKPLVNTGTSIEIKEGRHPVVEEYLPIGEFVPNDTFLNLKESRIAILTGPNMSGKSTYMRQVALIVLMAQIGSFVPAESATVGIVDRIFTRVGASDDLASGQSTFMVEMTEVANILNNATEKSLVILDEVGRGTATFDGLSIAWAVTEYLHDHIGSKAIFATHYHELTELEEKLEGVFNLQVAVQHSGKQIFFLRKIIPGGSDRSYGIDVARLAGLPEELLKRAREVLYDLEKGSKKQETKINQLSLFQTQEDPLREELREIDVNNLTPLEALNVLSKLVKEAKRRP